MDWQDGDITFDGVRIHYYRRGRGRPLVVAHGFGDNGRCWTRVAGALEDRFEVIAFDARSHGRSDVAPNPDDPARSDIVRLSEELGLRRPALIGHSMGAGSVAAAAAARPELFACAVLEDPGWRTAEQAARPRPPLRDFSGLTESQLIEEARKFGWHEDELQPWAESKLQLRATSLPGAAPADAWNAAVSGLAGLPALLVSADNARGAIVTPESAEEARTLCPTLEVVRIEGAGHNIRRDAFDAFMAAVTAFLDAHSEPAQPG